MRSREVEDSQTVVNYCITVSKGNGVSVHDSGKFEIVRSKLV